MPQELRSFVVNMKSLDQDIADPIVAGAGDANGRSFRVIFTQEAKAQMTPDTKVYLKWKHLQYDVRGYNVFNHICDCPETWEIHWPQAMLHEGDVLCRIELVDSISIAPSVNFTVHVLSDPDDGSKFVLSDDYSEFQAAVIDLNSLSNKMREQMEQQAKEFENMKNQFEELNDKVDEALDKANEALDKVENIMQVNVAAEVYMNELT